MAGEEDIKDKNITYILAGMEQSREEDTHHINGFVQFGTQKSFVPARDTINNFLGVSNVYLMPIEDKELANYIPYCKKEGAYLELGTRRTLGNNRFTSEYEAKKKKAEKIIEAHKKRKDMKRMIEKDPLSIDMVKKYQGFRAVERTTRPNVLYIHGPKGCGKSENVQLALEKSKYTYYKKPPGEKWFDGYDQDDVCVLEEFQSDFCCSAFLTLCDNRTHRVPIKGNFVNFNSPWIILISNIRPEDQYLKLKEKEEWDPETKQKIVVPAKKQEAWHAYMRRVENHFDPIDDLYERRAKSGKDYTLDYPDNNDWRWFHSSKYATDVHLPRKLVWDYIQERVSEFLRKDHYHIDDALVREPGVVEAEELKKKRDEMRQLRLVQQPIQDSDISNSDGSLDYQD